MSAPDFVDSRSSSCILFGMPSPKKSTTAKTKSVSEDDFRTAFASLLRSRKVAVPKGLLDAPPEAYASQSASIVEQLARLSDGELKTYAQKVASYAQRQRERAKLAWESSPLILELRRRKLKEPALPQRVVGASVSLRKPIGDWSDRELLRAADEWSRRASAT